MSLSGLFSFALGLLFYFYPYTGQYCRDCANVIWSWLVSKIRKGGSRTEIHKSNIASSPHVIFLESVRYMDLINKPVVCEEKWWQWIKKQDSRTWCFRTGKKHIQKIRSKSERKEKMTETWVSWDLGLWRTDKIVSYWNQ